MLLKVSIGLAIMVLLVVYVIIAKKMVEKDALLAKNLVMGKDSPEKIESMKTIVDNIVDNGEYSFSNLAEDNLTVNIVKKKGEFKQIRITSPRTSVFYFSKEEEPVVTNYGYSKKGAIISVFCTLILYTILLVVVLAMFATIIALVSMVAKNK